MTTDIYIDGGVIQSNPSIHGGTWAFIAGDMRKSGVVTPRMTGFPMVTNNYTELYAAVMALEQMPDGWSGTIHTDSLITLRRLTYRKAKMNGIDEQLKMRLDLARHRLGKIKVLHVSGHPTKEELAAGKCTKGRPVSPLNVECDKMCQVEAMRFLVARSEE